LLLPLAMCACATTRLAEPRTTAGAASRGVPARPPHFPAEPPYLTRQISVQLGDELDDCGHPLITFDYDAANVRANDSDELMALAACLNSPKYEHLKLRLVGRADPRGSERYNDRLGLERARAVQDKLAQYGVARDRMTAATRGDEGAPLRSNAVSYGYDRRVDVVELGVIHTP